MSRLMPPLAELAMGTAWFAVGAAALGASWLVVRFVKAQVAYRRWRRGVERGEP